MASNTTATIPLRDAIKVASEAVPRDMPSGVIRESLRDFARQYGERRGLVLSDRDIDPHISRILKKRDMIMGEPGSPSTTERASRRAIAEEFVDAVIDDEASPLRKMMTEADELAFEHFEHRDDIEAMVFGLAQETSMLFDRQSDHLAQIRSLSQKTPTDDEASVAPVLIGEVGTLRARVRQLEEALREACSRATTPMPADRVRILELRQLADGGEITSADGLGPEVRNGLLAAWARGVAAMDALGYSFREDDLVELRRLAGTKRGPSTTATVTVTVTP